VARPWSPNDEIEGLSPREVVFVAVADGRVVGFQTLDRWASYPSFMDNVGQLGTFVLPEWRGGRWDKDWCRRHSSSRALTTTRSW